MDCVSCKSGNVVFEDVERRESIKDYSKESETNMDLNPDNYHYLKQRLYSCEDCGCEFIFTLNRKNFKRGDIRILREGMGGAIKF